MKIFTVIFILLSFTTLSCSTSKKTVKPNEQRKKIKNNAGFISSSSEKKPYLDFLISNIENLNNHKKTSILFLKKALSKDKDSVFLKKKLIRELISANNIDEAWQLTEEIISKLPEDTEALGLKAAIYVLKNRPVSEIVEIYENIISIDPENQKAAVALGYLLEKQGKRKELIKKFKEISIKTEKNFFIYLYLGEALIKEKRYDEAKNYLEKAVNINDKQGDAKLLLIEAIKHSSDHGMKRKRIISLYQDVIKNNSSFIKALLDLSLYYRECGMIKDSNNTLSEFIKNWPDQKKQISAIILQMIKGGMDHEVKMVAIKIYEYTEDDSIMMITADLYNKSGKKEKALEFYNKITPSSKYYISAVSLTSYIYADSKEYNKAEKRLKEALSKFSDSTQLLMVLGGIFEEDKKLNKAEEVYRKGIELKPDLLWKFYFRLGVVQDKKGERDKAVSSMKKALKLNPDNASILNYLGYTYADMGINLDQAEKMLKKAMSLKPDDGYITDSLGWVYFKKNELKKAEELLKKAYSIVNTDAVILEHLGDLNIRLKQDKEALKYYKKVLEIAPDNKKVMKKIKDLK